MKPGTVQIYTFGEVQPELDPAPMAKILMEIAHEAAERRRAA